MADSGERATKRGRGRLRNAELLKWIDQNKEHFSTPHDASEHEELGFVSHLFRACLLLYAAIWKKYCGDRTRTRAQQNRVRENLGRLVLWDDSFGHGRLEFCLETSTELRDIVLEILYNIGRCLTRGLSPYAPPCYIS